MSIFHQYLYFHSLKLEIALAIPALNDEKWKRTIRHHLIWEVSIFRQYKYFHRLKLEIALAIPAFNDEK